MLLRRVAFVALLVAMLLAALPAEAAREARAQRFDVDIHLATDGSAQVTETLVFVYTGGPFTFVSRELPTDRTDGLTNFQASLDGAELPPGQQAGQVEIAPGNPTVVTWRFAPTSDSTHTFQLSYRVLGVVRQDPDADVFAWQALPGRHDYPIASSTVRVFFPPSVAMPTPPQAMDSLANVEQAPGQVTLTAQDLQPDATLTAVLHFAPRSLASVMPNWQAGETRRAALTRQNLPAFAGLSLLILVAGAAGLIAFGRRYPTPQVAMAAAAGSPPDDLRPALAGLLASGAQHAQPSSTLFDLARRGVVSIDELPKNRWGKASYQITFQAQPPDLRPHEQVLLDVLFRAPATAGAGVKMDEAGRRLVSGAGKFSSALRADAAAAGYLDQERDRARRALVAGALLVLFASVAGLLLVLDVRDVLGDAVLLVPGTVFAVCVFAVVVGSALAPWSQAGWQEAARWRAFSAYLAGLVKGRTPAAGPEVFEQYLAYAASFGLAEGWVKLFRRQGAVPVPPWFKTLAASTDGSAAVIAMIAATSSAASAAAAGASAAGAAGGGASATG